jgi:hypothetical protein
MNQRNKILSAGPADDNFKSSEIYKESYFQIEDS